MKCGVQRCPGEYEHRFIVHAVKRGGEALVIEDVPAEVCDVCSDMLLAPETVRRLEDLMRRHPETGKQAPVYAYA